MAGTRGHLARAGQNLAAVATVVASRRPHRRRTAADGSPRSGKGSVLGGLVRLLDGDNPWPTRRVTTPQSPKNAARLNVNPMKIPLTYGAVIAVGGMVLTLIEYLLGFHSDLAKFETSQRISQIGGIAISLVGLVLAMRAVRAKAPDGSLSYGCAVGTGALTTMFSGIFSAVFMLIYGKFINPEFHDLLFEMTTRAMTAQQAESAAGILRFFTGPIWMSAMVLIMSPLFGTLFSLIVALFMKRAPQSPPLPPVATV